jgi:hypothetical protein
MMGDRKLLQRLEALEERVEALEAGARHAKDARALAAAFGTPTGATRVDTDVRRDEYAYQPPGDR